MHIDIVVFDGIDEVDAIGPFEVFSNAVKAVQDVRVQLVTLTAQPSVRGSCGLEFIPHGIWNPGEADILVVPGGGWGTRADIGVYGEVQRGKWTGPLLRARAKTPLVAGVCTGTMLLASAGLVTGRRAVTHRAALDDLRANGADVVLDKVVDDGDLVTCGGVTSGFDLALWIVERECSPALAAGIARGMEYERSRPATA